jgi:hypothetical protein
MSYAMILWYQAHNRINNDKSYPKRSFPLMMAYAGADIKGKNTYSCFANHKISRKMHS